MLRGTMESLEQTTERCLLACLRGTMWGQVDLIHLEVSSENSAAMLVVNHGGDHETPEVFALEGGGYYDFKLIKE